MLTEHDAAALQEAAGSAIKAHRAPMGGGVLVRLRVRHLRCVHCGDRGLLIAGSRPVPLTPSAAAVPR